MIFKLIVIFMSTLIAHGELEQKEILDNEILSSFNNIFLITKIKLENGIDEYKIDKLGDNMASLNIFKNKKFISLSAPIVNNENGVKSQYFRLNNKYVAESWISIIVDEAEYVIALKAVNIK